MKKITIVVLTILLTACGSGGSDANDKGAASDPAPTPDPVAVTISPVDQMVPAGNCITFKASVSNATDKTVGWQVNGIAGGNDTVGTITSDGIYTAPKVPPSGGSVEVTAISRSDASASASTTVTITFSNASLAGDFIFDISGQESGGDFAALGRVHADGRGNLTGVEDYNGPDGVFQDIGFDGSYSINADGTGVANVNSSRGPVTVRLLLLNAATIEMIEFDGAATAVGEMVARADVAAIVDNLENYNYVFSLSGTTAADADTAIVGLIKASGTDGSFSGQEDRNEDGTVEANAALTGSYTIASNGGGTATITDSHGTAHYRLYAVSNDEIRLLSLDPGVILSGSAQRQTFAGAFNSGILAGDYVFLSAGESTRGDIATAGRFSADGAGTIATGIEDQNDAGSILSGRTFSGTYTIGTDGRGQAVFANGADKSTFTFYVVSKGGQSVWLETDGVAASGTAFPQTGDFSTAAIKGHYGFFCAAVAGGQPAASLGTVKADGAGNIVGSEVVDQAGTLSSELALTGTYAAAANGRGTVSINTNGGATAHYVIYGIVPQVFILLGIDSGTAAVGLVAQQY